MCIKWYVKMNTTMKLFFSFLLSIITVLSYSQNRFSLAIGGGAAYTFHRPENYDDGLDLIEVGKRKGPIGYTYALDFKLEKRNINWGIQYNFREFKERVNRKGYLGSYVNGIYYPQTHEYVIDGNLYHKQRALNIYAEKNIARNDNYLFSIGVGPSFFWERNQYMGGQSAVSPGAPFDVSSSDYRMYKSGEFGGYAFLNTERKIKNRYSLGVKLDFTYLITISKLENTGLLAYLKVEL